MLKFSLLILLLFSTIISYSQVNYTAVITEPQIGLGENANNLIKVVDNINLRENVTQVIVLGNITANGKFDEFIWVQEILDGLNVPYFVVGGEIDYKLSEGKGSEISLLWGDDKKIFYDKNYSLVCVNTILPGYSDRNYIEAETLSWLKESLTKSSVPKIITFSYNPISKADNSRIFFETTLGNKLFSLVSKEEKSSKEIPVFEGFYLNRNNDWGYLLLSANKDTLIIKKMLGEELKNKTKPEIIKSTFATSAIYESIKSVNTFSTENKLWSVNLKKTIQTSPVFSGDEIFAGFKNGLIICLTGSGNEKWRYNTPGKINAFMKIENDLLVAATSGGDVLTLNADTGNLVQSIGIGESITSDIVCFDFEENGIKRKAIVLGTVYGNLYCYDVYSFELIWTNQVTDEWINSSIVYSDNKIFFQDKAGTVYCLSAGNGLLIWKMSASQGGWKAQDGNFNSDISGNIFFNNNNLYLVDVVGNFFCIDALLGTLKWNAKNLDVNGPMRLNTKKEILLPSSKNKILTISPKSGKVVSEIELPAETKSTEITDFLVVGDNIITGFSNGWVYKIKPKQKPEKIFRGGTAPVISLINVNDDCLVTDYDGNFTLLKISPGKK